MARDLDRALADLPVVTVKDQDEFADEQRSQINQMLYLIYALLGLAVIIAILGIINTLALSVIERTREIGLLRAVGLSRRQLKRMLRLESIVIALLGAALGVGLGVAFGVALQRSLADDGIDVLAVPWPQLGALRRAGRARRHPRRVVAGLAGLQARHPQGGHDRVSPLDRAAGRRARPQGRRARHRCARQVNMRMFCASVSAYCAPAAAST